MTFDSVMSFKRQLSLEKGSCQLPRLLDQIFREISAEFRLVLQLDAAIITRRFIVGLVTLTVHSWEWGLG